MPYTLGTAATAAAVNKSTILRAIRSGKISATRTEQGIWSIDPAELHRVYPPRSEARPGATRQHATDADKLLEAQIAGLRDVAELLRAQLEDVRADRDHWRGQAESMTRQIADQRERQPTADQRRPWWRRLRQSAA
jgi:hypothetical protein